MKGLTILYSENIHEYFNSVQDEPTTFSIQKSVDKTFNADKNNCKSISLELKSRKCYTMDIKFQGFPLNPHQGKNLSSYAKKT